MDQAKLDQVVADITKGKIAGKPSLVILMGLPFSGKSTLGEKLSERGLVHLWMTRIRKRYELARFENVWPLVPELTDRLLASGYSVAVDFLNHTREQRWELVKLAKRHSAPALIVWLDPPAELLERRRLETEKLGSTEGRSRVSEEYMAVFASELEPPEGDYVHLKAVRESDINEIVKFCKAASALGA